MKIPAQIKNGMAIREIFSVPMMACWANTTALISGFNTKYTMEPPRTAIYTGTLRNNRTSITMADNIRTSLIAACRLLCFRFYTFNDAVKIAEDHINVRKNRNSVYGCIRNL